MKTMKVGNTLVFFYNKYSSIYIVYSILKYNKLSKIIKQSKVGEKWSEAPAGGAADADHYDSVGECVTSELLIFSPDATPETYLQSKESKMN